MLVPVKPSKWSQNHQELKATHFRAEELGPQASCWCTS